MSAAFYVYILFDKQAIPRYVGKGKNRRATNHLRRSHNADVRRLVKNSGGDLPIVIVRDSITETEAFETEAALIAAIGRGMDGPLLNLTDGGDGVSGYKWTPEQIAAVRAARKGFILSPEARAKISAALSGVPKSPEHRAAAAAARKGIGIGQKFSQAHREAIGRAHLGKTRSPEAVAAMVAAHAAKTPEQRAQKSQRITMALTGKKLSAAHRAKISEVQKGMPKPRSSTIRSPSQHELF